MGGVEYQVWVLVFAQAGAGGLPCPVAFWLVLLLFYNIESSTMRCDAKWTDSFSIDASEYSDDASTMRHELRC